jgi:hypothetical protein
MTESQVSGTWRLVSLESRDGDDQINHPMGRDAIGILIYSADGYMSVQIMKVGRSTFGSADLFGGSMEETAVAAASYMAYGGRYEVHADMALHYVEVNLFPNWVGTTRKRFLQISGDRLTVSTLPMLIAGKEQTSHAIWERVRVG